MRKESAFNQYMRELYDEHNVRCVEDAIDRNFTSKLCAAFISDNEFSSDLPRDVIFIIDKLLINYFNYEDDPKIKKKIFKALQSAAIASTLDAAAIWLDDHADGFRDLSEPPRVEDSAEYHYAPEKRSTE